MKNPYVGQVLWDVPENVEIQVTMFRDSQGADYDDKEWTFFVEEVFHLSSVNCVTFYSLYLC